VSRAIAQPASIELEKYRFWRLAPPDGFTNKVYKGFNIQQILHHIARLSSNKIHYTFFKVALKVGFVT